MVVSRNKPGPASTEVPAGRTDLGRRIAARRQELGLTREQVGKRCGADATYVAYLEEHAAAPAIGSLARIADALGTTVAELTGATTGYPPGRGTALRDAELITLTDAERRRLLSSHGVGRVAVLTPEGPAIFPVNYVVAGDEIAFRTSEGASREGRKDGGGLRGRPHRRRYETRLECHGRGRGRGRRRCGGQAASRCRCALDALGRRRPYPLDEDHTDPDHRTARGAAVSNSARSSLTPTGCCSTRLPSTLPPGSRHSTAASTPGHRSAGGSRPSTPNGSTGAWSTASPAMTVRWPS
ncbi:DNA-binding protein [Streptomyces sp. Mg1]|nr:DNA-binding protein [Streptomyces sp. Mg1]